MKTKPLKPFIGKYETEVEPGMWRNQWYVMWNGNEHRFNTYELANHFMRSINASSSDK